MYDDGSETVDILFVIHSISVDAGRNDADFAPGPVRNLISLFVGVELGFGQTQQMELGGQSKLLDLGKGRNASDNVNIELTILKTLEGR